MGLRTIQTTDDITHVALSGRLDSSAVRDLEKQFNEQAVSPGKPLMIDLYEVTFLSSMAMRMLLTAAKQLNGQGAKIVLFNPHRMAEMALKAAGLNGIMAMEHEMNQALKLLKPEQ